MKKKKSREIWKKTGQDLQDYLLFRKRGSQSLRIANNIIGRRPREKERKKNNG